MNAFALNTEVCAKPAILGVRTQVLRPDFPAGRLAEFDGDDDLGTFHVGVFDGSTEAIACVSFMKRAAEWTGDGYQLRGMAVEKTRQGQGLGRRLIDKGMVELALLGAPLVWCNARASAVAFYTKTGFAVRGPSFEIEGIGPHFVMWRHVPEGLA